MAVVTPISWQQNVGTTNSAVTARMALGAAVKGYGPFAANYLAGRGGTIRRGTGANLLMAQQGGGTMSVVAEPGMCYVPGTEALVQGGYVVGFDSSTTVGPFATAHATLNRTDTVYVKVRDQVYSGANNDAQILIAAGTPGGAAGSLSGIANVFALGQVTVRAGATSILTSDINNNARIFVAPGGVTPTRADESTEDGCYPSELSIYQNNFRVWDSGALLWRSLGITKFASLGSVFNPQADDMSFLTTTKMFNRWTGSVWEEWVPNVLRARLRQTSQQNLVSGANTPITFNVEDKDMLNGHSTVTATSRYTCTRNGAYKFSGAVSFAPNTSGHRTVRIWKNGANTSSLGNSITHSPAPSGTNTVVGSRQVTLDLVIGDYVELIGLQNSGVTLTTANDNDSQCTFEVEYVGQ